MLILFWKKNNNLYNLTPEQNLYKYEGNREINKETEVAIYSTLLKDYYLILVDKNLEGKLNLKLYINPLVSFLWLGSLISIIGGSMLFFRRKLNDWFSYTNINISFIIYVYFKTPSY